VCELLGEFVGLFECEHWPNRNIMRLRIGSVAHREEVKVRCKRVLSIFIMATFYHPLSTEIRREI